VCLFVSVRRRKNSLQVSLSVSAFYSASSPQHVSLCLSVCLFVNVSVCMCACLSVCVRRRKNSLQGSMSASAVSPASSPQLSPALSLSLSLSVCVCMYVCLSVCVRRRKNSLQGSMSASAVSPASSPQLGPARPMAHLVATVPDTRTATPPGSPSVSSVAWRARLHSIKNNFLGSPRFHRKKLQGLSVDVFLWTNLTCPLSFQNGDHCIFNGN